MSNSKSPKKILEIARKYEKRGRFKEAALRYAQLAQYLLRKKDYEPAKKLIAKGHSLDPKMTRLSFLKVILSIQSKQAEPVIAEELRTFVYLLIKQKKIEKYHKEFKLYFKRFPKVMKLYYEALLDHNPYNTQVLYKLSKIYLNLDDPESARRHAILVYRIDPNEKNLDLIQEVFLRVGDDEYPEIIEEVKRGNIKSEDLVRLLSHYNSKNVNQIDHFVEESSLYSVVDQLEKKFSLSLSVNESDFDGYFEKLYQISEKNELLKYDLAVACYQMGCFEEAIILLERGTLLINELFFLGELYLVSDKKLKALEVYQRIEKKRDELCESQEIELSYAMIQTYLTLGKLGKAWVGLKKFVSHAPDYRAVKTYYKKIEQILFLDE